MADDDAQSIPAPPESAPAPEVAPAEPAADIAPSDPAPAPPTAENEPVPEISEPEARPSPSTPVSQPPASPADKEPRHWTDADRAKAAAVHHQQTEAELAKIVEFAKKTGAVVTVEEHQIHGGLGGAVAEVLAKHFPVPMEFIGMKDTFGESGSPTELIEKYGMGVKDIKHAVHRVMKRK